ncbi:hypothetical protein SAMN05444484_11536, partial [Flavobacterium chilense]
MKLTTCTFLFVLFLSFTHIRAQTEGENKNYIPNITVSTPQAASLSKVGEIPIDISTGRINYTIPIFEIKEGNFTMPINLSYNYSGLLLSETPGYAGVGWTFNIGGSIMHSVNGLNDENHEYNKEYVYKYLNKLPPYDDVTSPAGRTTIQHFLENIANGIFDGEPDKYNVNAGNLSCSFYLDKNNNPIFLKNENYKLSGYSYSGFTLTDDQGINYVFNIALGADFISSSDINYNYTSSFLLKEINFPNTTNKITFEYDSNPISYNDSNQSQSIIKTSNQIAYSNLSLRTNTTTTVLNTLKLKKIITSTYTIELQYNTNPAEPAIAVITNLSVKDKSSNSVKSYDFSYSGWTGRRTNLMNVKYNGAITNEMEYDMSTPYPIIADNSDYYKKDLWGYYNEKGRPAIYSSINIDSNPNIKPDYNSTKIGALTKITYQTKGYSLIEYEPNKVLMQSGEYNFPYAADALTEKNYGANAQSNGETKIDDTLEITKAPVSLSLNYSLRNLTSYPRTDNRRDAKVLLVKIDDQTTIYSTSKGWDFEGNWLGVATVNGTATAYISTAGKYKLVAISDPGTTASLTTKLEQLPDNFNQTVGGIRIKQIKNCDFNGECITTAYNYEQNAKSTGIMLQRPKFYSGYYIQDNTGCNSTYVRQDFYNYTSVYPLSNFRGSPVLYKTVEKSDFGKNQNNQLLSNGKTIFTYYGQPSANSLVDEENYFYTGLLKTKTIKNEANVVLTNQANTYLFGEKRDIPQYVYALEVKAVRETWLPAGNVIGSGCILPYPRPMNDYQVNQFRHEAKNYGLLTDENKSFYYGQEITQTTANNYNLNTGYLTNQINTNSKGETLETKYSYATDAVMAGEPLRDLLISKNMIGSPLKIESYNNGNKLSEKVTKYGSYTPTGQSLLLPQYIYAKKGNIVPDQLEKKITFDSYDTFGNITQYTPENGSPVTIIWGYIKSVPIAKIENATNAEVAAALGLSDINSIDESSLAGINNLRTTLPNAMITTYTYIPLVGVSTITDPKGDKITYT